ncbi:MAG: DUF1553 domain-containing protein [Verrucomicrobiota bacterium]
MRHFGKPLVPTVFDFGRKGTLPTHPELLDWLAVELVEGGQGEHRQPAWSMKHLHRLIVTSNAYRMTSSSAGASGDNLTNRSREPFLLADESHSYGITGRSRHVAGSGG